MNPLHATLIAKAGYDNGFENAVEQAGRAVMLSSAQHASSLRITSESGGYQVEVLQGTQALRHELEREFAGGLPQETFQCANESRLHTFLSRAAALSRSLPGQAADDYQNEVAAELGQLPQHLHGTEVERLVRQRIGQDKYRNAMLDYWDGACAVTGIRIPELLRASHAKSWAECASDAERLDVFNGFLLAAHLDALFDRFLISFDAQGKIMFAKTLETVQLQTIGMTPELSLRRIEPRHEPYLQWHRKQLGRVFSADTAR